MQLLFCLLFFFLPWSVEYPISGLGNINLPTEPVLGVLAIILTIKMLKKIPPRLNKKTEEGTWEDKTQQIGTAILTIWLLWMWICAFASTMPWVSIKFCLVATTHALVFFGGAMLFPEMVKKAIPYFCISLSGLVLYSVLGWASLGFRVDQALLTPMPFFPEHNMYAAALVASIWLSGRNKIVLLVLIVGLICSTSRTAMLTCLATGVLYFMPYLQRLSFFSKRAYIYKSSIALFFFMVIGGLYQNTSSITHYIEQDVSLQERLNRYKCALRMVSERPLFGYGPGTYQFQYIPFQKESEMTRISAASPIIEHSVHTFGRGGGSHSEYLGSLAELGYIGLLILLFLVFFAFMRLTVSIYTFALSSLLLHFALNNFLHDARIAALVWISYAFLLLQKNEPPPLSWLILTSRNVKIHRLLILF
jgi:putative inorganic carbon (hco3(-)) transporter